MTQPVQDQVIELTPEEKAAAEAERIADTHQWVGAANVPLTLAQAYTVELRTAVVLPGDTRIPVVEVYCKLCRRPFDDCNDVECPAMDPKRNEHLRGGPIGQRKKRGPQPARDPYEDDEQL